MSEPYVFEVYRDPQEEWRWRLRSRRNGKTVADSGEGYKNRAHALRMVGVIKRLRSTTPTVIDP